MKNIIIKSLFSTSTNVLIGQHVGLTCCRYQYQFAQVKENGFEPSWNAMWDMCVLRVPTNQYFFHGFVFFMFWLNLIRLCRFLRPSDLHATQSKRQSTWKTAPHEHESQHTLTLTQMQPISWWKFFKSVCSTRESYTFINRLLAEKNNLKQEKNVNGKAKTN